MDTLIVKKTAQNALIEKSASVNDFNQTNVLRLVRQVMRHVNSNIKARLKANGFGELSARHLSVFEFLDVEGTNIVTLARRAGVTKQAMSKFVKEASAAGYVNVLRDTVDTRSLYVTFTAKGTQLMDVMHSEVKNIGENISQNSLISTEEATTGFTTLIKLLSYFEQNQKAVPSDN